MDNFTDLILLVGTNPLPNYVVADYFLSQENSIKTIWLICSENTKRLKGTKELADNLKKQLEEKYNNLEFKIECISDVSNATTIKNEVTKKITNELLQNDANTKVHLNYTGGTKVMGIHVYRALEAAAKKGLSLSPESFSYLDARTFNLVDDCEKVINEDLRKKVWISFANLIELHGFERKNKDSDLDFSPAVNTFKEFINGNCLDSSFFDVKNGGYNRDLFLKDEVEDGKEDGKLAEKISELTEDNKKKLEAYNCNESLKKVIEKMPGDYQLFSFDDGCKFNEGISNKKFKKATKFIDGGWLEDYVHETLTNKFNGKISNEYIKKNWVIRKPEWRDGNEFELDVILMNGYQLIGISCTLDDKKHVKNKGFEIMLRTRQIGGDEAKAVLITRVQNTDKKKTVEKLQEELRLETGGTANILVLGRDDLKEDILFKKIQDFIK